MKSGYKRAAQEKQENERTVRQEKKEQIASIQDHRPEAEGQRKIQMQIHDSPAAVAQRKQLKGFINPSQHPEYEGEESMQGKFISQLAKAPDEDEELKS